MTFSLKNQIGFSDNFKVSLKGNHCFNIKCIVNSEHLHADKVADEAVDKIVRFPSLQDPITLLFRLPALVLTRCIFPIVHMAIGTSKIDFPHFYNICNLR